MGDQVSRPVQIALLAVVAFAALWFVALRPKPAPTTSASTPPASAPAATPASGAGGSGSGASGTDDRTAYKKAVDGAKGAVGASQAAADATKAADRSTDTATGGTAAAPSSPTPAPAGGATSKAGSAPASPAPSTSTKPDTAKAPKPAPAKPTAPAAVVAVGKALQRNQVIVLLFSDGRSADDRFVERSLRGVSRHGGKVAVVSASLARLGDLGAITRGVEVTQSPSVLVIDRRRQAQVIQGYTDTAVIDQKVSDALTGAR